jgi:hypothetical protein
MFKGIEAVLRESCARVDEWNGVKAYLLPEVIKTNAILFV